MSTRNIVETAIDLTKGSKAVTWEALVAQFFRQNREKSQWVKPICRD